MTDETFEPWAKAWCERVLNGWPSATTTSFTHSKGYELRVSREELRRIYLAEAGRCFDRGERSDLERSLWELAKSTVAATSGVGWPE